MKIKYLITLFLYLCFISLVNASTEGLMAHYSFDENKGNVTHDLSGNGNDGVIYGANWVEGISGKALEFDGKDDYVEVPDSASLNINSAITIESWINSKPGNEYPVGNPTFNSGSSGGNSNQFSPENTLQEDDAWGYISGADAWDGDSLGANWIWDFGATELRVLSIKWYASTKQYPPNFCINTLYSIDASPDNKTWTVIRSFTHTTETTTPVYKDESCGFYRYLRVRFNSNKKCLAKPAGIYVDSVRSQPLAVIKEGSYGIGATNTEVFGLINDKLISSQTIPGWKHVVLTYNEAGKANNMKLYVNGNLESQQTLTGAINTSASNLKIGNILFKGIIDEVKIYSRALNDGEIKANAKLSEDIKNIPAPTPTENLTIIISPSNPKSGEKMEILVKYRDKPAANAKITITLPNGATLNEETNTEGILITGLQAGKSIITVETNKFTASKEITVSGGGFSFPYLWILVVLTILILVYFILKRFNE